MSFHVFVQNDYPYSFKSLPERVCWGDESRWWIYKNRGTGEWLVLPPDTSPDLGHSFPTFEAARAAFAAGHK